MREKARRYANVNWKEVLIEATESRVRQLETEEILSKIDGLNDDPGTSDVPAWKLIRENRDAGQ